jgi:hypothetical protein
MNHPFLTLIVLVVLFVLRRVIARLAMFVLVRTILRKFLAGIGSKAVNQQPDAIHLMALPQHRWADGAAVAALAAPLPALGFAEAGTYRVEELAGVFVRFLVHAEERVAACIYEHPRVGTWIDFFSHYRDESTFTATTAPDSGMDKRPGATGFHASGTAADALYERMLRERPRAALIEMTTANVVERFAWAWAKSTAWRKQRGVSVGEMAEQLKRHAAKQSFSPRESG